MKGKTSGDPLCLTHRFPPISKNYPCKIFQGNLQEHDSSIDAHSSKNGRLNYAFLVPQSGLFVLFDYVQLKCLIGLIVVSNAPRHISAP